MRLVKNLEPCSLTPSLQSRSLYEMRPVYTLKPQTKHRRKAQLLDLNSDQFKTLLSLLTLADCHYLHLALSSSRRNKCLRSQIESHILTASIRQVDQLLYINSFVQIYSVSTITMLKFLNSKCKRQPYLEVIKSDVDRTYVRGDRYLSTKKFMINLLAALAANFPRIGYIQGFNYLAKNMYENGLSESQAFAFLSFLLKEKQLESLYLNNMQRVTEYCYVLDVYLFNFIPDLYRFLRQVDIDVMYFAAGWFITLFSQQLPTHTVNRIWNMFLLKGWKVLIKFALAVLLAYRKQIMEKSREALSTYLRYFLQTSFSPKKEDEIFKIYLSIKVTNKMVEFFCRKMTQVERDSQISLKRMRKNSVEGSLDLTVHKQNSSLSYEGSQQNWCYCQYKKQPPPTTLPRQFFSFCQNSDDVIY